METVDILAIVDSLDNLLLIDVLGQRELYDKSVDIIVLIQFVDTGQQFFLRDVSLKADEGALETTGLAG